MARKRPKQRPPAAETREPYDAAAVEAETERLRHELADRILRLRCKYPHRCSHGPCRRRKECLRLV